MIPTATYTPSLTPSPVSTLSGPYAVILVASNDALNIRSGPGVSYPVTGTFAYNEKNVMRTGPASTISGTLWYQVRHPLGGTGWVNANYLTEYTQPVTFCSDTHIQPLLNQLKQAMTASDGNLFASLVSPNHGVDVRYWHSGYTVNYTSTQAAGVFTSTTQQNWGAGPSGENTIGSFANVVQPKLLDVLNIAYELYCNDPHVATMFSEPWPAVYTNFNYYSVFKPGTPGIDLDYRQWMIGFEYVRGLPYFASMIHIVWEP